MGVALGHFFRRFLGLFQVSPPMQDGGTNIAKMNCSQLFGEFCTFLVTSFFTGKQSHEKKKKVWSEL